MPETLLTELLERSFLFDDPAAYRAGVEDAWEALAALRAADDGRTPAATAA